MDNSDVNVVDNSSQEDDEATEEEYEVEQILDCKKLDGEKVYRIRWKGYGSETDTWEPEHNLSCYQLLIDFKAAYKHRKQLSSRQHISSLKSDLKLQITCCSSANTSSPAQSSVFESEIDDDDDDEDNDEINPPLLSSLDISQEIVAVSSPKHYNDEDEEDNSDNIDLLDQESEDKMNSSNDSVRQCKRQSVGYYEDATSASSASDADLRIGGATKISSGINGGRRKSRVTPKRAVKQQSIKQQQEIEVKKYVTRSQNKGATRGRKRGSGTGDSNVGKLSRVTRTRARGGRRGVKKLVRVVSDESDDEDSDNINREESDVETEQVEVSNMNSLISGLQPAQALGSLHSSLLSSPILTSKQEDNLNTNHNNNVDGSMDSLMTNLEDEEDAWEVIDEAEYNSSGSESSRHADDNVMDTEGVQSSIATPECIQETDDTLGQLTTDESEIQIQMQQTSLGNDHGIIMNAADQPCNEVVSCNGLLMNTTEVKTGQSITKHVVVESTISDAKATARTEVKSGSKTYEILNNNSGPPRRGGDAIFALGTASNKTVIKKMATPREIFIQALESIPIVSSIQEAITQITEDQKSKAIKVTYEELRNFVINGQANEVKLSLLHPEHPCVNLPPASRSKLNNASKFGNNVHQESLLCSAARRGFDDILDILLEAEADVNAVDFEGNTALMYAVEQGFLTTSLILLNAHAYVNVVNKKGETAIIKAVKRGHKSCVESLLRYGCLYSSLLSSQKSSLYFAQLMKLTEIESLISNHDAMLCKLLRIRMQQCIHSYADIIEYLPVTHCLSVCESQEQFFIDFHSNVPPVRKGEGNLLFLANAVFNDANSDANGAARWKVAFAGACCVVKVILNNVIQESLTKDSAFVMSLAPLEDGCNRLVIYTNRSDNFRLRILVQGVRIKLKTVETAKSAMLRNPVT